MIGPSVILFCCIFIGSLHTIVAVDCPEPAKAIFCYYQSWSYYREGLAHYNVSMIDPFLCTHLIFAFSGLDLNNQIVSLDPAFDFGLGGYRDFVGLKEKNPCLQIYLAIGGWNEGSRKYSVMVNEIDEGSIDKFANSVLRYVSAYGFDGFDLDWEYPNARGGIPADKTNFPKLLRALKAKFEPYGIKLSVAIGAASSLVDTSYAISEIYDAVDYILLMTYDYTSTIEGLKTGLLAPLYDTCEAGPTETIEKTVNLWLNAANAQPGKLILGIPSYAKTFNLTNNDENGIGASTNGAGIAGEFTKEKGFLSYFELLEYTSSSVYTSECVTDCSNCYAYYRNNWFSYDSLDTIKEKVQFVKEKGLGGCMVWAIDFDDFLKLYSDTKYPVINAINETLYS